MDATIAITISASSTFFFFISPIPIHARNSFASVDSSPERRVPRTAFGVFHARQGMDALAGGSQGDGARALFIQICSQADRIPIYNGAVSSAAGCWAAACAAFAASFFAAIFAACSCLNLFNCPARLCALQGVFSEVMPIRKSNDTLFYLIGNIGVQGVQTR